MSGTRDVQLEEEEAKRSILRELNMTEAALDEAVDKVDYWLQHQPHLPHTVDSNVLRSFIIGCRSVEVAKDKLEKYFMARINFPAELSDRNPNKIAWEKIQPLAYLPELTPEGYLVLFLTMPDLERTPGFDFLETVRYIVMMSEIIIRERPYIAGQIYLFDLKHLSIKLIPKVSLSGAANALFLFEQVYPFVMKSIYNFNTPQVADSLQRALIKPIMSNGLYNMIVSYTQDESSLAEHVPVDILPQDYGGKAPTLRQIMDEWRSKLNKHSGLFSGECSLLPDESKIPKQKLNNTNFGSSGTFRKLEVD